MTKGMIPVRSAVTSIIAGASALMLAACGMTFPPPQGDAGMPPTPTPVVTCPNPIATVAEAHGEAYVVRAGSSERASPGDALCPGDGFRTGAGWMRVQTDSGSVITVYENTDPRIFKDAACFAVSFFHSGKLDIWGSGVCVNGVLKQGSLVGYEASGGVLRVWVVEGSVRLLRRPFTIIHGGEQAVILRGGMARVSPLNRAEFDRLFPRARAPEQQQPVIL